MEAGIVIWLWVLFLGLIGGIAHQIAEAFIPNMRKTNIIRAVISGIIGTIVVAIILGVFNGAELTIDMMIMLIIAGYAGDSVVINMAKRNIGGLKKLISTEIETIIDNSMSNINHMIPSPPEPSPKDEEEDK